jgi:hypothetical protein
VSRGQLRNTEIPTIEKRIAWMEVVLRSSTKQNIIVGWHYTPPIAGCMFARTIVVRHVVAVDAFCPSAQCL